MGKYIDAEKLKAEIGKRKYEVFPTGDGKVRVCSTPNQIQLGWLNALKWVCETITSLQQEQSEDSKGKFVFPKFLYARTRDNKTIDMSYAPQDMTAVEYIRNDFVEQEQPEVDLEKEYKEYVEDDPVFSILTNRNVGLAIARHFFNLGLDARKEE